jgi:uncharacterized protein (TIGR03067 family)
MKIHALLVLASGLLLAADDKPEEAIKKDREKIAGAWTVVLTEMNGTKVEDEELKKIVVTFKADGTVEVRREGEKVADAVTKIDPTKKPKEIDITIKTPDGNERNVKGIYEIEGDDLKICTSSPGQDRPKEFTAKEGTGNSLRAYKRKK